MKLQPYLTGNVERICGPRVCGWGWGALREQNPRRQPSALAGSQAPLHEVWVRDFVSLGHQGPLGDAQRGKN